jgi:hypothetical protein
MRDAPSERKLTIGESGLVVQRMKIRNLAHRGSRVTRNDFLVSKKNSKKLTSMSDDSYDSMGTSGTQDSEKTGIGDNDDALFNSESMVAMEAGKQPFEMSLNHSKILILISKYAKAVTTSSGKEGTWIRELPLSVMIYEGIVAGIIDCDYAPKSMVISSEGI